MRTLLRVVAAALCALGLSASLRAAPLPRALWVWDATTITTATKRQELLDFCRLKGFTTLFLYTGGVFMTPADAAGKVAVTRAQLGNFNIAAHAAGLKVHALDGDPSYCLSENLDRVRARQALAVDFNFRQSPHARLDGFQWDIEPHGLAAWKASAANQPALLAGFLEVARLLVDDARGATPALPVGFAIPFWFDAPGRSLVFEGADRPPAHHLFEILESSASPHVALMSYRDTVDGSGGTLDVTAAERAYARQNTPAVTIWIGQETGPFDPPEITFSQEGPCALDLAIARLSDSLRGDAAVAGIAVHQYAYLRELLWAQPSLGDRRLELTLEAGRWRLRFSRAARDRCFVETSTDFAGWTPVATFDPADLAWTAAAGSGAPELFATESLRPDGLMNVVLSFAADAADRRFFRVRAP